MQIEKNGDRIPAFNLFNVQKGKLVRMGHFDTLFNDTINIKGRFNFPGYTEEIPVDVPKCGFDNEFCVRKCNSFRHFAEMFI